LWLAETSQQPIISQTTWLKVSTPHCNYFMCPKPLNWAKKNLREKNTQWQKCKGKPKSWNGGPRLSGGPTQQSLPPPLGLETPARSQAKRIDAWPIKHTKFAHTRPGWGSCYACHLTVHSGQSKQTVEFACLHFGSMTEPGPNFWRNSPFLTMSKLAVCRGAFACCELHLSGEKTLWCCWLACCAWTLGMWTENCWISMYVQMCSNQARMGLK
jgi:hypothetical protein